MSFLDTAAAIATALGQGWAAEPGYVQYTEHALLRHPDGQCLDLRSGNGSHRRCEHGRVIVRGGFNGLSRYGTTTDRAHTITVAATRSPAEIARDIVRRLLPDYETDLAVCRTQDRAHRVTLTRRDATVAQVHHILAPSRIIHEDHVSFGSSSGPMSGTVRVLYSGGAEFTLLASSARVLELARHLAALAVLETTGIDCAA